MSGIITNYVAPKPVNPYAPIIDQLVDAGEGAAYALEERTTAPEGQRGSFTGEKAKLQAAAREKGYSIVQQERTDDESTGITRAVFKLAPLRVVKPRESKPEGDTKAK